MNLWEIEIHFGVFLRARIILFTHTAIHLRKKKEKQMMRIVITFEKPKLSKKVGGSTRSLTGLLLFSNILDWEALATQAGVKTL